MITEIMFSLIRFELCGTPISTKTIDSIDSEVLKELYTLSASHDLAHVVADALSNIGKLGNDEISEKFKNKAFIAIYRYERINYELENICKILSEAKIPFVPLKGAVIRDFYSEGWLRTSSDIDILVQESDLDSAISNLESKGFICGDRNYHDVSLYSPNKIHLELHFSVLENIDFLDVVLKDAWQYTTLSTDSRYDFSKEFFVFHMHAHMANHFLSGGCGIRSLMDIWVMEHKMDAHFSWAEDLLKKAGIYKFSEEMSNIANKCFTENETDVFSDLLLEYICNGGVYGSTENNIAVYKAKTNSSLMYLLERLFLPFKYMVISYPILKKAPFLLPFCWIKRWIKGAFRGKTRELASEMSYANNVTDVRLTEITEMLSRLGF